LYMIHKYLILLLIQDTEYVKNYLKFYGIDMNKFLLMFLRSLTPEIKPCAAAKQGIGFIFLLSNVF